MATARGRPCVNVARAVGPAIGGLIVATVGAGWVFALNAVSFVGIAIVLAVLAVAGARTTRCRPSGWSRRSARAGATSATR